MKPTIFVVTDIETTWKKLAFDVAWLAIDRAGNAYCKGSYLITNTFKLDVPFYRSKMGHYFEDTYEHLIEPVTMTKLRNLFNADIQALLDAGHRVVFCAYNAAFDSRYLGETCMKLIDKPFLESPLPMLDIWHYWGLSVPKHYNAPLTASGKYLSTSAESVFKFEFDNPGFVERHIAWSDVLIERDILLKVLKRKKPMPIVHRRKDFRPNIWKDVNTSLGILGDIVLGKPNTYAQL